MAATELKWPSINTMFDIIASHVCCDMWITVSALYRMLENDHYALSEPQVFKVQLNQLKRHGILELRKLPPVAGIGSEGWQWRLTPEARAIRPQRLERKCYKKLEAA